MTNPMQKRIIPNGINGATGGYLLAPQNPREITAVARREGLARTRAPGVTRVLAEGLDPKDLAQAGWGVIFAHSERERLAGLKEALAPLLQLRREQAGPRYREYTGPDAYRPNETAQAFRTRFGLGYGPVDPSKMPYYLLLVADPRNLPFEFQYQMDVQHGVGRIHFDRLEDYHLYAQSVVAAETGQIRRSRQAAFFGVRNPDDLATRLTADELIAPLARWVPTDQPQWHVQTVAPEQATKQKLRALLGGPETPALLFAAGHGIGFPLHDHRQSAHQGALLCQDWPGPEAWREPIPQDFYLAGDDIEDTAQVQGTIAFLYACYGAGMPQQDYFAEGGDGPGQIAEHPFLARLPQRLLAHPRGGALAVIGHVERTWSSSFLWEGASQIQVFQSTLKRLMEGHPTGSALEYFNLRHAELAAALSERLEVARIDSMYRLLTDEYHYEVAPLWAAHHDARSYVTLGDPAVRLPVTAGEPEVTFAPAPAVIAQAAGDPTPESPAQEEPPTASAGAPPLPAAHSQVSADDQGITVTTYVVADATAAAAPTVAARTVIRPDGTMETTVAGAYAGSWALLTLHGDTVRAAAVAGIARIPKSKSP